MPTKLTPAAVAQAVDDLRPELFAFIQTLVRTPSLSGQEHAVQALIAAQMRALGLAVDIVPTRFDDLRGHPAFDDDGFAPEGRINVVGRRPGAGGAGARSLILNGHVDVVSPGDAALWTRPPWGGVIEAGRLYGRGACDMKAGVATGLYALAALDRLGVRLRGEVLMESVIGEESGGVGTLTTIVKGYTADAAVVLEPTRLRVCPVQSGALTFRLTVAGKAAHAAMRQHGVSAIEKFAGLLAALRALEQARHAAYTNAMFEEPGFVAPISVGTVTGGEWHSTVPERVVAEGRLGVFPGESTMAARQALEAAMAEAAQADPWLRAHPPQVTWFEGQFESGVTAADHPLLQTLGAAHAQATGQAPAVRGVPYGSDLRLFTNHARLPAVLYGAGDVALAHAVDEYIELDEVATAVQVIALLMADWCGIAGSD